MPEHVRCRVCRDPLPAPFLDLGTMPLANSFLAPDDDVAAEPRYPLAVAGCRGCGLVQLTYVVPAEQLYRNYIYVSSTSETVRAHAEWLAERAVRRYGWGANTLVMEVASNDGTVLKAFQRRGVGVLGIEPARNIAALAQADGVPTVTEFFTEHTADRLRTDRGAASAILARHVFAHVDDVHDFLRGVERLLAPDGVLILEVHYVGALLRHLEFDTIYHEHLSYFGLGPMERLAADHGLVVTDAEVVPMHGGSLLVSLQRKGSDAIATPGVEQLRREEAARAIGAPGTLAAFARDVATWKERFEALIADLVRGGAVLAAYGAAAKGNTLLNYCPDVAAHLRYILDRSPHKRGRLAPGSHLPVRDAVGWEPDGTTHVLLLAWNFKEEIIRQMRAFAERGGKFVVPIPRPEVL